MPGGGEEGGGGGEEGEGGEDGEEGEEGEEGEGGEKEERERAREKVCIVRESVCRSQLQQLDQPLHQAQKRAQSRDPREERRGGVGERVRKSVCRTLVLVGEQQTP